MEEYFIGRAMEGISINGKEWLLDEKGNPLSFPSQDKAVRFLIENGYSNLSKDEILDTFFIQTDFN